MERSFPRNTSNPISLSFTPPISTFFERSNSSPSLHHTITELDPLSFKVSPSNSTPSSPSLPSPNNELLPHHFFRAEIPLLKTGPGLSRDNAKGGEIVHRHLSFFFAKMKATRSGAEESGERSGEHGRRGATVRSLYERRSERNSIRLGRGRA